MRTPTTTELESAHEAYLRKRVRLAGGRVYKLIGTERGAPDRLVMMPGGGLYLVELKTLTGSASALQRVWHAKALALGTVVAVLPGRLHIDNWLRSVLPDHVTRSGNAKAPAARTAP